MKNWLAALVICCLAVQASSCVHSRADKAVPAVAPTTDTQDSENVAGRGNGGGDAAVSDLRVRYVATTTEGDGPDLSELADEVPDDPDTPEPADGYFPPYVLRSGDVVGEPVVFGFHRRDAERFRVALLDAETCRQALAAAAEECHREPCKNNPWMPAVIGGGVGVLGGVAVTVLAVFLVR